MGERAILKFTSTQFITLPAFAVAAPTELVSASLSLSFWVMVTTKPDGAVSMFRYSNSEVKTFFFKETD